MNDTLREALEELAEKCRGFSTYGAFTPGARRAYEFMLADVETILEDHATILAAHPADTETELGDLAAHRADWADYIESWESTVGTPICNPQAIAQALRWANAPFGKAQGS